ncbi:type IV secretion system protein [Streptosporangium jomthongense]|uniref:Type IV secretion system protein n=1 Tax=Streptosporangium jomthongense TaxID=1193683 RepID=A0ABV8FB57_9ACTN
MKGSREGSRNSRKRRLRRRIAITLVALAAFFALPMLVPTGDSTAVAAGPCDLSPDLAPEIVGSGVDGLVKAPPPDTPAAGTPTAAPTPAPTAPGAAPQSNYARYGTGGQFWHTYGLGCGDVAAVMGNMTANTVFSWAKALDRLTITTYQAAATEGPLESIKGVVDDIVGNLAEAMYWPYLRPIVILGAIWLAWYGLIRKRATTTAEGIIWMVLAVTVAVWFFSRPGDFTGLGKTVTDKTGEVVNSAFSNLPNAGGASCLAPKDVANPQAKPGGYGQTGVPGVDQNAEALWSTLVCKPWLMGVFGTADPNAPVVKVFGAKLLDIQALDAAELKANQTPNTNAHQARYEEEVASKLQNTPIFFLFQGKDWTSRLGIAIGALMAAMVAGLLIFLVAVSLLVLKIGFLLLLILAPVFLLIGVHPGSGRIIAMRWVEMLIGTLLRQAVLALVLGVLVYGYALIIATELPWGMQVMFMALMTIAVFFYRRPFQHLFSSMDGHTFTTRMLGEAASAPTLQRAAGVLPPVAAARAGRWGMRKAEPVLQAAAMAGGASVATAAAAVAQGKVRGEEGDRGAGAGTRVPAGAQPAPLDTEAQSGNRRKGVGRPVTATRTGAAPPLNLSGGAGGSAPARTGSAGRGTGSGGSAGSGGSGSGGGWFGGSSGGWAPRGSSGGSSTGRSSGGGRSSAPSSGSRPSSGGGRSSGSSGGGRSGGGLFGGGGGNNGGGSRRAESSPRGSGSSGGSSRSGSSIFSSSGSRDDAGRGRSSEAPPLWLASRPERDRQAGEAAPFWLRASNPDKD